MAQKQFKIGLSNTDKQNMAQDVYERVLALTFNEYDTTTEYEVGDFVVYNDQLYKCISATSGAWDNSKWQLATLNDLVADIEGAVAFVNDKANVDGNYPTMTVGAADNLTPYDEDSGVDQEQPFLLQGTGCGNGEQQVDTGDLGLLKEKQGNTVVVNQLADGTSGDDNGITFAKVNSYTWTLSGIATAKASRIIFYDANSIAGHKYLLFDNSSNSNVHLCANTDLTENNSIQTGGTFNATLTVENGTDLTSPITVKLHIVDLTQWFGSNDAIPEDLLDNPEDFFRYYQGSLAYNEGTLVNSNGRYLKTIGRQQWDEEWENKYFYVSGNSVLSANSGNCVSSKNAIKVIPNATYYIKVPAGISLFKIFFLDKDGNYADGQVNDVSSTAFNVPANATQMLFYVEKGSSYTYNHDITISIYYSGEGGYDQYYPYELLTDNDTGVEVLRSAGNVRDSKEPNGTIHRKVGRIDLGDLSWTYTGSKFVANMPNDAAEIRGTGEGNENGICSKYQNVWDDPANFYNDVLDKAFIYNSLYFSNEKSVYIRDTSYTDATAFKTAMSGVYLFYELAEEVIEQGTPYSANLEIDDFGSMQFEGANGVPQGNLIFYPVDYKAFIDTLHKYTDGTPSNIALKSDLSADKTELQGIDAQLKNALGGTLRQCLCVKESLDFDNTAFVDLGELTWTYVGNNAFSAINVGVKSVANDAVLKALSTKYKFVSYNTLNGDATKVCMCGYVGNDSRIYVRDTAYTDATAFKNAMKGVLLAYEKASE